MHIEFIKNGDVFTTTENIILKTELGSCVSLCLWDPVRKIGGMNHYLLPTRTEVRKKPSECGDYSNKALIKAMVSKGSKTGDLRGVIFGGASLRLLTDRFRIGEKNIQIAEEIVRAYRIPIVDRFTGGNFTRSIYFTNYEGLIKLREIEMNTGISYCQTIKIK